ncbi:hypothetical protein KP509_09G037400 [Ceratopteris richardii]|uniref:Uncharacterized protein n=1 Tax=Ceratopteris richardii TaxID=49495 RepID=A0A8T2U0H5_CERRI|nr:hypothetical protein KP509_09G037400 [Ceratopteris richardii]KAH7429218.1 hypothetical protein KP509_09G037400 [Ceratopteris richardii]
MPSPYSTSSYGVNPLSASFSGIYASPDHHNTMISPRVPAFSPSPTFLSGTPSPGSRIQCEDDVLIMDGTVLPERRSFQDAFNRTLPMAQQIGDSDIMALEQSSPGVQLRYIASCNNNQDTGGIRTSTPDMRRGYLRTHHDSLFPTESPSRSCGLNSDDLNLSQNSVFVPASSSNYASDYLRFTMNLPWNRRATPSRHMQLARDPSQASDLQELPFPNHNMTYVDEMPSSAPTYVHNTLPSIGPRNMGLSPQSVGGQPFTDKQLERAPLSSVSTPSDRISMPSHKITDTYSSNLLSLEASSSNTNFRNRNRKRNYSRGTKLKASARPYSPKREHSFSLKNLERNPVTAPTGTKIEGGWKQLASTVQKELESSFDNSVANNLHRLPPTHLKQLVKCDFLLKESLKQLNDPDQLFQEMNEDTVEVLMPRRKIRLPVFDQICKLSIFDALDSE